ncbi:hypothetical protein XA68_15247 [Ophiocordyceps unilateralis]|uniref:Uncharacterized protein n=1 Tax=Ophiocordyceps unilateralis TaxID=268505 RepID=A0A2A9P785_OPHUN|nr:hypothetical protein XA68_15247 [Ophiocordyceps unilateralis]
MDLLSLLSLCLFPLVCLSSVIGQSSSPGLAGHHVVPEVYGPSERFESWKRLKRRSVESGPASGATAIPNEQVENKLIAIGLYLRPSYSMAVGDVNSFHQAIIVSSATNHIEVYDAVNSVVSGQTFVDGKPPWRFQFEETISPEKARLLVARVVLGETVASSADIYKILEPLPMPCRGENCVSWVKSGLQALQDARHLQPFDIDLVVLKAVDYGVPRHKLALKPGAMDFATWEKYRNTISRYQPREGIIVPDPAAVKIEQNVAKAEARKVTAGPSTGSKQTLEEVYSSPADEMKKRSLKNFKMLVDRHGLEDIQQRTKLSTDQLHERFMDKHKGNFRLTPRGVGLTTLGGVAVIAWGYSIYDVFKQDSTALEKTAVVTALVPVVGCVTQALANDQSSSLNIARIADYHVCLVADGLTVSGFWAIGIPLQVMRILTHGVMEIIKFREKVKEENLHQLRSEGWKKVLERFETVLRSESYIGNVGLELDATRAGILLAASEAYADFEAGMTESLNETLPTSPRKAHDVANAQAEALNMIHQETCRKLQQSKEELRWQLKRDLGRALHHQSREYDDRFATNLLKEWETKSFSVSRQELSKSYRRVMEKNPLMAMEGVRGLSGIIDQHLGVAWALPPNCSHPDPLPPRPRPRNPDCDDPCPSKASGTPVFEELTGVGKGQFECVFRNPQGQSIYEFRPICCPFTNMERLVTAVDRVERVRCVDKKPKR